MQRSRTTFAAGTVLTALVGLRAVFVAVTAADPVFRVPYLDSAFDHVWAGSLASGQGDFHGPYFIGPLFPHALRWLYAVCGPDVFAARVAQTVLGCGEIVLLAWVGTRLFGLLAGLLAASLFALYSTQVFYEGLLTMEVLVSFLVTAAFAVLVASHGRPAWRALLCGALIGTASLGRGTELLLVPVGCLLVLRVGGRWRHVWLLLAACVLVLTPTLVRNARLGAGPVLTTNAGVNFYAGNAPGSKGRFAEPPGVRFFRSVGAIAPEQQALPSAVAARALTVESVAGTPDAADSRLWFGRSWAWIRSDPRGFAALLVRKVFLVLQSREIAQIESVEFHKQRISALKWFPVNLAWILPLAVLGWWAMRKQALARAAVLAYAVTLMLPCVLFFVTARYRLHAVPFLALLAGCGAAYLVRAAVARRFVTLGAALAAVVVMALLTRVGAKPPPTAAGWENAQMAERVYVLGDLDGTIAYQEVAARQLPNRLEVQMNLALYWSERKRGDDLARAASLLETVAHRWPREALVQFNLGTVYEAQQRIADARSAYEHALRLDPTLGPARQALAVLRSSREP